MQLETFFGLLLLFFAASFLSTLLLSHVFLQRHRASLKTRRCRQPRLNGSNSEYFAESDVDLETDEEDAVQKVNNSLLLNYCLYIEGNQTIVKNNYKYIL